MSMMSCEDDADAEGEDGAGAPLLRSRHGRADELDERGVLAVSRNPAVDVYSFGITAWELMARTTPYNDRTSDADVVE